MSEVKEKKEKPGLIFQKIPAIMADIKSIGKDRENKQQNFSYRGVDDAYNEIQPILVKHKVFTVPIVIDTLHEERKSKAGGTLIYRIYTVKYQFYAEDGSSVTAVVVGEGMDSSDKAGNKAMSGAHKYALLQVFCVPTKDPKDSEVDSLSVKWEPQAESQSVRRQTPSAAPNNGEPQDDGSIGALADKAEEDKDKKEAIAGGVRTKLELRTVDPKAFKLYLASIQDGKGRKFVGKKFGNPSLTEGVLKDLRYLEKYLDNFIDNFIETSTEKARDHVQPN